MEQFRPVKTKFSELKRFLYETFRPHTKAEYTDFFTRGIKRDEGGEEQLYKAYPFVYARVFVILALLFGLSSAILYFTENSISFPVVTLLGGLIVNLPLVVLIYELYPLKNISLPFIAAVMIFGGIASVLMLQIVYWLYFPSDDVAYSVYVGFVEELFKALPVFLLVRLNKKRTPFYGLLMGIAVGAGMAICEDVGYIFTYSDLGYYIDYYSLASVSIARGVTAVCTHIVWTGIIGYAFARFNKPLSNPRFYGMFILCVALHAMWDMPEEVLGIGLLALDYFVCAVVALVLIIRALRHERKLVFAAMLPTPEAIADAPAANGEPAVEVRVAKKSVLANACMGICTLVIAVCGTIVCLHCGDWYVYAEKNFKTADEMLEYVQSSVVFDVDTERPFATTMFDYEDIYSNGRLIGATQQVLGEYTAYYRYSFEYSGLTRKASLDEIWVEYGDNTYYMNTVETADGNINYFNVNTHVYDVECNSDGTFTVTLDRVVFAGAAEMYTLLITAVIAAFGVAAGAAILLNEKNRRVLKAADENINDKENDDVE